MKWSIEELIIGWKCIMGNPGRNIFKKIFTFFRYFPRATMYTFTWIWTGYFPTTWWMSDSIILRSIRGYTDNFIKTKKKYPHGFSTTILDQLEETKILNDETSKIAMLAYEVIAERIIFLISCLLEEEPHFYRYTDTPEQYEIDTKELFMLLEKYHHLFWD
jgi:hypothetical protein